MTDIHERTPPLFHSLTASKVPSITATFWLLKILTTAMGEATSDFLVTHTQPVAAVVATAAVFAGALALQFALRRYVPWAYWFAVVMVSVFGTMVADVVHIVLGVPYAVSTIAIAALLTAVFVAWFLSEKTLSIHSITTRRRELFYWATVLVTFALGTATGDLTATTLHLGYLGSGVVFAVVIAVPAIGFRWLRFNAIIAFWFAYIVTRPLGASFADWAGVAAGRGGLGWGTGLVSAGLTAMIVVVVACVSLARRRNDTARMLAPKVR